MEELKLFSKNDISLIVDKCFHAYASSYRTDAVDMAQELFSELPEQNIPKHETVSQWEERTGEIYPDDGPVWLFQVYPEIDNSWWSIQEYGDHKKWQISRKDSGLTEGELKIIVATHHGKPESI